jgi:Tol biopolymer transport system component
VSAAGRTARLAAWLLPALALSVIGGAGRARADVFGGTTMLSSSPFGQAEFAHDPALSEDGQWVVFDGSVGGVAGVWRRATSPGARLEEVAGGDATLPSLSADGRYVSFTTNQGSSLPSITDELRHDAAGTLEAPSVYVRDMAVPASATGAFTLVSAKDRSAQSLTYEFPETSEPQLAEDRIAYGASAEGRSAISADGRSVAFVTTAQSDLAGAGTPPLQVAVRRLDSQETELVSVRYDNATSGVVVDPETGTPRPVPFAEGHGAVWSRGIPRFNQREGEIPHAYNVPHLAGASISADGTTVAWLGQQVGEQAATLSGEALPGLYAEPLWRRVADGPLAPTRRVTGGSEPESAACRAHPESRLGAPSAGDPCQGPFATQETSGFGTWNDAHQETVVTPRLSADGSKVAFISTAPLVSEAGAFGLAGSEFNGDAYWMDMAAPTRVAGLRQITQFASSDKTKLATNADIEDIGISPDGAQVAFTTKRTVFPLSVPAYVSQPAAVPGLAEVYDADMSNQTLTRVSRGFEGGVPSHPEEEAGKEDRYPREADGAMSPSFSHGGETLAFSSTASNLVYGDGNTPPIGGSTDFADGADAFLVPRISFSPEPTPQTISPAPPNPSPQPPWKLIVSASSLPDGAVQIKAIVPGAGTLAASASSALPASAARRGHRKVRRLVARASTAAKPGASGPAKLQLRLSGRYSALASRAGGLAGSVTVTFLSPGHPALHQTIAVRFVRRRSHHTTRTGR